MEKKEALVIAHPLVKEFFQARGKLCTEKEIDRNIAHLQQELQKRYQVQNDVLSRGANLYTSLTGRAPSFG